MKLETNSQGDTVQIVSFYDPNDLFGFPIPKDEQNGTNITLINVPISHSTQWTIDGQRLKRDYLYRLPIGEMKDQLSYEIGNQQEFNVLTNLEEPSEDAKNNKHVFNYLLNGNANVGVNGRRFTHADENPSSKDQNKPKGEKLKVKDGIEWKINNRLRREKNVLNLGTLLLIRKASSMIRTVELPHTSPPDTAISGIRACIRENKTTHILTVHGMGSKDSNHFDGMAEGLATRLGFVPDHTHRPLIADTTGRDIPYSIRQLAFLNGEGKQLFFYIVHWSPITRPIKEQLAELNRAAANDPDIESSDKSLIHRTLKDKIIIDGFVDVNLSLGNGGFLEMMSDAVSHGMNLILQAHQLHGEEEKQNVFLVSGSLGSKVLYDHITKSLKEPCSRDHVHELGKCDKDITQFVMNKTRRWYMLTNQLPMIGPQRTQ